MLRSFKGAAAILEYQTIDSPLAQPRNAILGQVFAAIIGVGVTKLFQLSSDFDNLRWIAGALAVGLTSAFMGFTKTVHPPAGATARKIIHSLFLCLISSLGISTSKTPLRTQTQARYKHN